MPALGSVPGFKDGFRSLVTFAQAGEPVPAGIDLANLRIWIKEINPPGVDSGGPIEQTTMHNASVRTAWHKSLKSITQIQCVVAYSHDAFSQMYQLCGIHLQVNFTSPANRTVTFNGFIDKFTPNANKEGDQPTAQMVIVPTNIGTSGIVENVPSFG